MELVFYSFELGILLALMVYFGVTIVVYLFAIPFEIKEYVKKRKFQKICKKSYEKHKQEFDRICNSVPRYDGRFKSNYKLKGHYDD